MNQIVRFYTIYIIRKGSFIFADAVVDRIVFFVCLSIIDILWVLYEKILNLSEKENIIHDSFILSKGHAALALYVVLHLKGFISKEELDSYCANNSKLGVHPEHHLKGINFSTGSLGQGVTFATGSALAAKIEKSKKNDLLLIE